MFQEWKYQKFETAQGREVNQPHSFRVTCDRACVEMKKHGFTSMEAAGFTLISLHDLLVLWKVTIFAEYFHFHQLL